MSTTEHNHKPVVHIIGDNARAVIFDDGTVLSPTEAEDSREYGWDGPDPDCPAIEATELVHVVANHPDASRMVTDLFIGRHPEDAADMVASYSRTETDSG